MLLGVVDNASTSSQKCARDVTGVFEIENS